MKIFEKIKQKKEVSRWSKIRKAAIETLNQEIENNSGPKKIFKPDEDFATQMDRYIEERNVKTLVDIRIDAYKNTGKKEIEYPPLLESIVNFLYIDYCLLEAQGDKDHEFHHSYENMMFIIG